MMDVAMHLRFGTIACLLRRLAAAVVLAGLGGLTCASAQQQLMLPPPPAADETAAPAAPPAVADGTRRREDGDRRHRQEFRRRRGRGCAGRAQAPARAVARPIARSDRPARTAAQANRTARGSAWFPARKAGLGRGGRRPGADASYRRTRRNRGRARPIQGACRPRHRSRRAHQSAPPRAVCRPAVRARPEPIRCRILARPGAIRSGRVRALGQPAILVEVLRARQRHSGEHGRGFGHPGRPDGRGMVGDAMAATAHRRTAKASSRQGAGGDGGADREHGHAARTPRRRRADLAEFRADARNGGRHRFRSCGGRRSGRFRARRRAGAVRASPTGAPAYRLCG